MGLFGLGKKKEEVKGGTSQKTWMLEGRYL